MSRRKPKGEHRFSSSDLPDPLLDVPAVARWLGVRPKTVYGLAARAEIPSIVLPGSRLLRFRRSDIEAALDARRREVLR